MREVYANAGINPDDVGFVEAHGTGTKVGDPIEARAIHNVFGATSTKRKPLHVGSVKTNVGHLENVSGIISVIKASMMLEKGFILPSLNFEKANENIPLDEWNMKVSLASVIYSPSDHSRSPKPSSRGLQASASSASTILALEARTRIVFLSVRRFRCLNSPWERQMQLQGSSSCLPTTRQHPRG